MTSSSSSLDIGQFTAEHIQSLLTQLIAQTRVSNKPYAPSAPPGTITEYGFMASTSIAGEVSIVFPSTNLRFENHILTFQHH